MDKNCTNCRQENQCPFRDSKPENCPEYQEPIDGKQVIESARFIQEYCLSHNTSCDDCILYIKDGDFHKCILQDDVYKWDLSLGEEDIQNE